MSRPTIARGAAELQGRRPLRPAAAARMRRAGGGRPKVEVIDPKIRPHLARILEETTAGDPMSLLRWTSKSTRTIADELTRRGHPVSAPTVARYLHDMGYSLAKTLEGRQHPDRDAQFRYINARVKAFLRTGDPVVSVDTKKKELIGAFRNAGRMWRPGGRPTEVFTHDFPQLGVGKALPYGTYDLAQDRAVVNVGVTHDTAEFAVESIRRWWRLMGKRAYPDARRLLISADAGGSNGNRLRAWKMHLQRLADELRVPITVCHFPPGTSKWNKIEHRLFSHIAMNWRGTPLVSLVAIVSLIGSTKTEAGLRVRSELDRGRYPMGIGVTDQQMARIRLVPHSFHGDWNYTVRPNRQKCL
jgi:hypothetical protein